MKLESKEIRWLAKSCPGLAHDAESNILAGELSFCASFEQSTGKLHLGKKADKLNPSFLCDAYSIRIDLGSRGPEGWPRVFETGGRSLAIAEREGVGVIDLHFYEDGGCCLGLRSVPERSFRIDRFVSELLIPFFYRLSNVDVHGLNETRRNLWGEYSHGDAGYIEYEKELFNIAIHLPGINDPCPCGSGRKYKRCHLDEVEAVRSWRTQPRRLWH